MASQPQQNVIQSERRRQLQPLTFVEGVVLTRDLPRDTVLKKLILRMSGAVQTTYASGSPVADSVATFDSWIPRIDIVVAGSRTVKSVRPYLMQQMQLLATGVLGERKASAGASAATANNPTADGGFVFGTTTQYTTVAETVEVYFEDIMITEGVGPYSWLNLKGQPSAEIRLNCSTFKNVQNVSDSTSVTYANSTVQVDISTVEAQHENRIFADLRETTKEVTFPAQQTEFAIDINRGNLLRGLAFLVRNGDSTKSLSNNAVTALKLMLNGQQIIQATTFKTLQAANKARFGLNAPFASNVSRQDGFAWMDMLQNNDWRTALNVSRSAGVDNLQLLVSTEVAGSGATYSSYPVSLTIMTQEIVMPS